MDNNFLIPIVVEQIAWTINTKDFPPNLFGFVNDNSSHDRELAKNNIDLFLKMYAQ